MSGPGCLAAPLVFRAPSGPAAWPGCLVCPPVTSIPIASGVRCCWWRRWCSGRRRARPPARSPHASLWLGVVDLEARPGPPDPPAPSAPAVLVSLCVVELPLEARPGPAAAHGYRSLALRHPGLAVLLLVAPLVFWAPSGPAAWPGCLVCPWAAARSRAVRAASFARRVVSKPGQAPPPPTGSAAWPSGAQALLFCCLWHRWCSGAVGPGRPRDRHTRASLGVVDLEARPGPPDPSAPSTLASLVSLCVVELPLEARSCPAPREIATHEPSARSGRSRSPPVPSGPSDALHTGGACVAVCGGASHRSPARPCRRPWVLQVGYPDPPALSMPAVLPGFAIDRIARGYCTG